MKAYLESFLFDQVCIIHGGVGDVLLSTSAGYLLTSRAYDNQQKHETLEVLADWQCFVTRRNYRHRWRGLGTEATLIRASLGCIECPLLPLR